MFLYRCFLRREQSDRALNRPCTASSTDRLDPCDAVAKHAAGAAAARPEVFIRLRRS